MVYYSPYNTHPSLLPTLSEEATKATLSPKKKKRKTQFLIPPPPFSSSSSRGSSSSLSSIGSGSNDWLTANSCTFRKLFARVMKLGPLLQLCLLLVILLLVLQADSRASFTAQQLSTFKEEESMLLLKLQRIERQSMQLHENIRTRLQRAGIFEDTADPLGRQMGHLEEMTKELDQQVAALQHRIQDSSVGHIVHEYGEGPVKVVLELAFDVADDDDAIKQEDFRRPTYYYHGETREDEATSNSQTISILLWPDTPHATWTWLEQIGRHVWDDAKFAWDTQEPILQLTPSQKDPLGRGNLEFVEHHKRYDLDYHGAWTIGLRQTEDGTLQMFLNLQDNAEFQKHETCVGKLLDGYDGLQRLLDTTRRNGDLNSVRVVRTSAMHMTKREIGMEFK